jgi:hypothetical protein
MKLSNEALLEIVAIFQAGLLGTKNASNGLRELDLIPLPEEDGEPKTLVLSSDYIEMHPRASTWIDDINKEVN